MIRFGVRIAAMRLVVSFGVAGAGMLSMAIRGA